MKRAKVHALNERRKMRSKVEPMGLKRETPLCPPAMALENEPDADALLKELRATVERAEIALKGVNRMPLSLELPSGRLLVFAASVGTLTIIMLANQLAQAIL